MSSTASDARVALVTGATRNLGAGIARRLAADGFVVAVNGRDADAGRGVIRDIESAGGRAFWLPADATDEAEVRSAVERVHDEAGPVSVLVNNAGARFASPIHETSLADWSRVIATVLTGTFLWTRELLPDMYASGWGRVVNLAGVSGQMGAADRAALVSAKSGIIGFTKAVSLEAAPHGVTVNTVSPALIDTQRAPVPGDSAGATEHYRELTAQLPVGRPGRVDEVAALVAFLCSEDAGYITGQLYAINGGILR